MRPPGESRIVTLMGNTKAFFWITATAAALFLATSGGRLYVSDSHVKLSTARSIVDRASTAIPSFGQLTVVSPETGRIYSKFEILHSLMMLPACFAAKGITAAGLAPPELRYPLESVLASAASPLFAALAAGLLFLFIQGLFRDRRSALALAALFCLATMVWPYSKRSWTELPQLTFLLSAAWLLVAARHRPGRALLLAAGASFGGVVALRITGIVLLPLFVLFLVLPPYPRDRIIERLSLFLVGIALMVLPLIAIVNQVQFGSLFAIYGWRSGGFTTNFALGLRGFLISPGESFFLYSPILLLAPLAARRLWLRDKGAFSLAFGIPAALMLLYASWWFHAYTWGPRFLLPAIPFLLVPVALVLRSSRPFARRLVIALVALSVFVQVLGVAFHLGDLPELAEPLMRAGWLPPDGELARNDTWHHPLRTRLASHLLVLVESIPKLLQGNASSIPIDFWPGTVKGMLGVPFRVSLPIEASLLGFFLFGFIKMRREWKRFERGIDQSAGTGSE